MKETSTDSVTVKTAFAYSGSGANRETEKLNNPPSLPSLKMFISLLVDINKLM